MIRGKSKGKQLKDLVKTRRNTGNRVFCCLDTCMVKWNTGANGILLEALVLFVFLLFLKHVINKSKEFTNQHKKKKIKTFFVANMVEDFFLTLRTSKYLNCSWPFPVFFTVWFISSRLLYSQRKVRILCWKIKVGT